MDFKNSKFVQNVRNSNGILYYNENIKGHSGLGVKG